MMRVLTGLLGAGATALCLAAPAAADVTPDQVWSDLRSYLETLGYDVEVEETASGGSLTLSGLSVTSDLPEEGGTSEVTLGTLILEDRGDGTVEVILPEMLPIDTIVRPTGEQPVEIGLHYTSQGGEMIVSGTPEDMRYSYSAASAALDLVRLVAEGREVPRSEASARIEMGQTDSETRVTTADGMRGYSQSSSIEDLAYDITLTDPETGGSGAFSGRFVDVTTTSGSEVPEDASGEDIAALVGAGFVSELAFRHEGSEGTFSFTEPAAPGPEGTAPGAPQTSSGTSSSTGGTLSGALSDSGFRLETSGTGVAYAMTGGDLPFPIRVSAEEMGFSLDLPLAADGRSQDMALGLTLDGLTLSDEIWGVFDPAAVLPRDPATLQIDLAGKVTPLVNVFDPEEMATLEAGDQPPAQLDALTLRNLTLDAAGARVTGEGAFTFDNTDLQSFDGMPRPEGQVELRVQGANALLDRLIEMGLMTNEDAMGARMMMSMFGVAGSEPDSLSSRIEVNGQGQVFANGQRIR